MWYVLSIYAGISWIGWLCHRANEIQTIQTYRKPKAILTFQNVQLHSVSHFYDLQIEFIGKNTIHHAAYSFDIREREKIILMYYEKIWERWRRYIIRHTACKRVLVSVLCAFVGNTSGETHWFVIWKEEEKKQHIFSHSEPKKRSDKKIWTQIHARRSHPHSFTHTPVSNIIQLI